MSLSNVVYDMQKTCENAFEYILLYKFHHVFIIMFISLIK